MKLLCVLEIFMIISVVTDIHFIPLCQLETPSLTS